MKKLKYSKLSKEFRKTIEPHFRQIINALDEYEYNAVEIYDNESFVAYSLKVEFTREEPSDEE